MIRIQIILIFVLFVVLNKVQEAVFRKHNLEVTGTVAVTPGIFKVGKLCLVFAWLASVVQAAGVNLRFVPVPHSGELLALALFYAGFVITALSYLHLGSANKIGLPQEATTLKTGGIYRFGRNPLYTGLFIIDIASCIYTANPVVVLFTAVAMRVYHQIILAEEKFLLGRFGTPYSEYTSRVNRYFII